MFRKLVSNLPFNPSILGEIAFYYGRLKQEEKLRRLGVVMVVLSMFVQLFAVISPPEPTLAASSNDIIHGGFDTRTQAWLMCLDETRDFQRILSYYGVDCGTLGKAETVWIKSTDYNKQLDSMGRESRGSVVTRTGKQTDEYPVSIANTTYFMRNLWAFDSGSHSTYKVLKMTNKHGDTVFVLYNCGNIVTDGKYSPPPPPPPPPPEPEDACPADPGVQESTNECDVCPNKNGVQTSVEECDVCPAVEGVQYNFEDCDVCPNIPGTQSTQEECYPCPEADEVNNVETCLKLDKAASNLTQDIDDANGTTAQPGDRIVYTLSVKNDGKVEVPDFTIKEDVSDILHYATITDRSGGEINDDDVIVWPEETIAPGRTVQKTITVEIKDPIPETPISTSDPTAYDLVMNNTFYGNSVNIEVPRSVNKTVETATRTLPQTGPGESMLVATAVTIFVGYFLARAHLLRKETQIIRLDYANGGQ
ncbi:MAG: hypothetical protein U5L95_01540 [Candidatus Saccharibacteria bacterium]|nr:hypothetical protein [Candidatus Saccharibacteria bacterium]